MSRAPSLPRVALFLAAFATAALAPSFALADPAADAERAVTLGHEGLALFQKGALADAYERFREAESLVHSPVFLLHMARAKRGLGDLLTARTHALRVARDPLPDGAPGSWVSAQADAIRELGELDAQIPRLRIELVHAPPGAAVMLDGLFVHQAELAGPIPVNPGEHVIAGQGLSGPVTVTVRVVADGTVSSIPLVFPVAERLAGPPDSPPPRPGEPSEGSLIPGLAVLGLGAVGLGVGVGAGLAAQSQADEVLSRCRGDVCLASDEGAAADAETLATLSTVGFITAGVAVPLGLGLVVWRPFGGSGEPATVALSPGRVVFRGSF